MGRGLEGLDAVDGGVLIGEGSSASRPRAQTLSLERGVNGDADPLVLGEEPSASRPRAQTISMERGINGDDDPIVGMRRVVMPMEVSKVVKRGTMTDEALHVEASKWQQWELGSEGRNPRVVKEEEEGGRPKFKICPRGIVHSFGVGRFLGWGAMGARGATGGVVVFWDNRVLELVGMEVGIFSILCRFKNCEDGFLWTFTGVYGPTMKRYRELFWEELGVIRGLWSDPWCIGGDFNVIFASPWGPFTWSGGLNGLSRSRLDSFMISEDWENHFSGAIQCSLPRLVSDHFPILLDGVGLEFDSIGVEETAMLEMFSVKEVSSALSELNGDKAPSPNGFSLAFWQFYWDFVKDEIMAIYGLRINLNKSEILLVGRVENAKLLAVELGCKVGSLPSTYLGLPLGALHKSVMVWDGVEKRMQKRLALWKRQFISKGRRITLIWSTLACMPTYLMSLLLRSLGLKEEGGVLAGLGGLWGGALEGNQCVGSGLLGFHGEEGGWTPRFLRPFNDWEVERFLLTIQGKRLNANVEDRMVWKETKNEIFTVKSLYNSLDHSCVVPFPWSIIWSPYVPTKVGFFAWEASWGKVLTQDQLKRRG
ncbi:hypothetical protein CK203_085751 [Vitis vinifera]|uniref:Uncharacterized protein n=1 Tax=Vitis vinifera TaxID=29760 RepID=A0A438EVW1_VITVI|nr:hypothetical protein CK203_085751 [Vitis vinifera]